jgi:hypothetical protein
MQKKSNSKSENNSSTFLNLKTLAIASAMLFLPLQSFAGNATNYGDINDEYVAWSAEKDTVKTSIPSKSKNKKSLKMHTKKLSESNLTNEYHTGYGDENQD